MKIGIFELHNPEREQEFRHGLSLIDFPWWRCLPYLSDRGQQIDVFYDDRMGMNFSGVWLADGGEYAGVGPYPAASLVLNGNHTGDLFTLAHELGHATDTCCLITWERTQLTELLHGQTKTGDFGHGTEVMQHNDNRWYGTTGEEYLTRLAEAHADAFVACFAPKIWDVRNVRFVHWPADLQQYRNTVLAKEIQVFTDVPSTHIFADDINLLAELGIVTGRDGKFSPHENITRGQMASTLARTIRLLRDEQV